LVNYAAETESSVMKADYYPRKRSGRTSVCKKVGGNLGMQRTVRGVYLVVIALIFALTACSGAEEYGTGVDPDLPLIQVRDVLSDSSIEGARVNVEGRIVNLCPSRGCWFYLQDDTGRMFVDLEPADITLPFRQGRTVGSRVKVSGTVGLNQGQPAMQAEGLEVW